MEISPVLKIKPGITALIGGGGKTTLLYTLSSELKDKGTVIICTSTHVRIPEDIRLVTAGVPEVKEALRNEGVVCVGKEAEDNKITASSIPFDTLQELADYVLVEADGSKGKPLKAHAEYEPVIPKGTDKTVLVVGGDGFYKPVNEACHRPEIWASLAGISIEDPATPEGEAKVIQSEGFGDIIFLNKTELPGVREAAKALRDLISIPLVVGSLIKGEFERWQ